MHESHMTHDMSSDKPVLQPVLQNTRSSGKGGIRICLPVHCLSALPDRQPYCRTNATSNLDSLVEGLREKLKGNN